MSSSNREYAGQAYGTPVTPTATMRFLVNRDGATKVCVIGDLPFVSSAQLSAAISASLSGYATTAALSAGLATKADSSALSNYALTSSLGDAATKNVGTTAGTVAAGDDSRFLTTAQQQMLADRVPMTGTALSVSTYGSARQVKDISGGAVEFTDLLPDGDVLDLLLLGSGPVTFPIGTVFPGGSAPALDSSGVTFMRFEKQGATLYGFLESGGKGGSATYGGFSRRVPAVSDFPTKTAFAPSVTKDDDNSPLVIGWNATTNNTGYSSYFKGAYRAKPSAEGIKTYIFKMRLLPVKESNSWGYTFTMKNSSTGKELRLFCWWTGNFWKIQKAPNEHDFGTSVKDIDFNDIYSMSQTWFKVTDDGTTVSYYFGHDKANWKLFGTTTLADYIGSYDLVGFSVVNAAGAGLFPETSYLSVEHYEDNDLVPYDIGLGVE